jgi:glycogen operon protein
LDAWKTKPGYPLPLGATVAPEGVNFSVFSRHATDVSLVIFEKANPEPVSEIPLDPALNKTGDIWHIFIVGFDPSLRYAYRVGGPYDPEGGGHRFNKDKLLLDPYARALEGGEHWGDDSVARTRGTNHASFQRRCCLVTNAFDWQGDQPLHVPLKDSVIYELHVRGYTIDNSSGVISRGTYKGLVEKIPYIKSLGVTAVELMPVFEFNELENERRNPKTGDPLKNLWGYSTMAFFVPKASYASDGWDGNQVREFKEMVKAFHQAGLEVLLDVVFNHTAEGNAEGPTISFRGLDNVIFYCLHPESKDYVNLSGCGNTVNCNHPVVQAFILDCLRYWVLEMHVDGFRFDLASILRRDDKGELLPGPTVVDVIEQDPVLAQTKIIAEAWDMQTNQVGAFPGRWAEWNEHYKNDIRRFVRGDAGMVPALATRIGGSSDLYQGSGRRPYNSINYVTCHDGFTLCDLVSYKHKYNEENGEDNQDGADENFSTNSGVEGPTDDREVNDLRMRRVKTFATILMVSHGVPMILAGDEFGRTQSGNNNAYCQDNETSWIDWHLTENNAGLLRFFRKIIALRNRHPVFRRPHFLTGEDTNLDEYPDVRWHGLTLNKPDWSGRSRVLAFVLDGSELTHETKDDDFYVALNGNTVRHRFQIPPPKPGKRWFRLIDTGRESPEDILDEGQSAAEIRRKRCSVLPMGAVVFISLKD